MSRKAVIFSSATCVPCKQLKQQLDGLAGVEYLDIEKDAAEAARLKVQGVPTTFLMDADNIEYSIAGAGPAVVREIRNFLRGL